MIFCSLVNLLVEEKSDCFVCPVAANFMHPTFLTQPLSFIGRVHFHKEAEHCELFLYLPRLLNTGASLVIALALFIHVKKKSDCAAHRLFATLLTYDNSVSSHDVSRISNSFKCTSFPSLCIRIEEVSLQKFSVRRYV